MSIDKIPSLYIFKKLPALAPIAQKIPCHFIPPQNPASLTLSFFHRFPNFQNKPNQRNASLYLEFSALLFPPITNPGLYPTLEYAETKKCAAKESMQY